MPAEAAAVVPVPVPEAVTAGLVLGDPAALAARLETYTQARGIFVDWLFNRLVPGTDYLLIHRKVGPRNAKTPCPNASDTSSPSCKTCGGRACLAKAGSEKITGLLQLRPRFRRDLETWEMLGAEPGLITFVCELLDAQSTVVAEGRGARHRDQDQGDQNKSIKMAAKSSQTDAVLRCAGLSEIFTQDIDEPGWTGDSDADAPAPFEAPRRQEKAAAPAPRAPQQGNLEDALRRSVAAAAARKAAAEATSTPPPARPTSSSTASANDESRPDDALSKARVGRLFALLHEAVEAADVPTDMHEPIFNRALDWLRSYVATTQGRRHLAHASYKKYEELVEQIPVAVEAALTGNPGPRPRPRIVRRTYSAPRQWQ